MQLTKDEFTVIDGMTKKQAKAKLESNTSRIVRSREIASYLGKGWLLVAERLEMENELLCQKV